MVFSWPGLHPRAQPKTDFRLVDVLPTVLNVMDIEYDEDDMDGRAIPLTLTAGRPAPRAERP
jgi:arylsulfatase A-like enzyme